MTSLLNVFSVHYFLWFAGITPIYGYISVYAEHYANASSSQYGLLNMILTFVTIVTKLFFCSLADRLRAHRLFFICFIITATIGYGSFGVLPFFIDPQPKDLGLNHGTWIAICLMTCLATISVDVVACLSDAFAMNTSLKNNTSYGTIRVWGTLGWGFGSLAILFINQSEKLPLLVPGLLLTIALLSTDILVTSFWPDRSEFELNRSYPGEKIQNSSCSNTTLDSHALVPLQAELSSNPSRNNDCGETDVVGVQAPAIGNPEDNETSNREVADIRIQWLLLKEVAKRRLSMFRYIVLFIISGALISLQWSFFFPYLKIIYKEDFTFISGLSMIGQSILGELPIFLLSKFIIRALGRFHTLSLSITTIGIRYLLYLYLLPKSSMYFVLLTEPIQGPCFGLFYVVMTEVGLDYSDCDEAIMVVVERGIIPNDSKRIQELRQALRATMQSLMSASYEGLGLGIGSIVGGLIIDHYGFESLWLWTSITAIVIGLSNFMIDICSKRLCDK